ncbi:hypothetical protein V1525DRAFT_352144 [Lipomyces kononenkoae]|uniref:Uncharacterized protein n=1 Tax=Lipomyces kononenkoae TaxID=34357 RepID=A0ACC3TCJ3_LIPKO
MVDNVGEELHQDDQPTSLKYHIFRSGGSDYYLTTNPNQKHIHDPIGPSYYVRVSTAGRKSKEATVDAQNDSDGSFSITIFVHDYDNVSVSSHSNEDSEQPNDMHEQQGLLVPIMHVRRIDGESKMTVTVIENGENVWETTVALHSDPYTGDSKFVFLDPWDRRWSLAGKDGIKCTSSLSDEPISTLEKKVLSDAKIAWITFERPALKMLDLMVGVNMAVFSFRNYEFNPSRLTAIATGILHADLNATKISQAKAKAKKRGFRISFTKKAETERVTHSNYSSKTQTEKRIVDPSPELVHSVQNGVGTAVPRGRQLPEFTQRDAISVADQPSAKYQPNSTIRSKESLDEPVPKILPAFAYQPPLPTLPGFSVSATTPDGVANGFVPTSDRHAESPLIQGEPQVPHQYQSGLEISTAQAHTEHQHYSDQRQSENTAPAVRRAGGQSTGHVAIRPMSTVEQQQTPPMETELQYQRLHQNPHQNPRIPARSQGENGFQTVPRTASVHRKISRNEIPPTLPNRPTHDPHNGRLHRDNSNRTDSLPQRRHPSTLRAPQSAVRPSAMPPASESSARADLHRRSMFVSSTSDTSGSPIVTQGPRPRPNSMLLPASNSPNGNRQKASYNAERQSQPSALQKDNSLRSQSQSSLLPGPQSPSGKKKKNRLSMIAIFK